jgi:ribonuclease P protein component
MLIRTGRFVRADRLLEPRDFKRVLESGERKSSRSFAIIVAPQPLGAQPAGKPHSRLGITVSRRVGNAVVRNGIKRRVREWFRHARRWLPDERDIVVIARPAASALSGSAIAVTLDQLAKRPDADGIEQVMVGSR